MKAFFSAVLLILCLGIPISIIGIVMGGGASELWVFLASLA